MKLIVNTGDETEFGTSVELTPTYLDQIADITAKVPMIWLAGNHDSPANIATMHSIPGVIVLGDKARHGTSYAVTAQSVDAFGLTIAGVPDPRVYGAAGAYGSDDTFGHRPARAHGRRRRSAACAKSTAVRHLRHP